MERAEGIEPSFREWKTRALTFELRPRDYRDRAARPVCDRANLAAQASSAMPRHGQSQVRAERFKAGHIHKEHQSVVIVNMFGRRIASMIRTTNKPRYRKRFWEIWAVSAGLVCPRLYRSGQILAGIKLTGKLESNCLTRHLTKSMAYGNI